MSDATSCYSSTSILLLEKFDEMPRKRSWRIELIRLIELRSREGIEGKRISGSVEDAAHLFARKVHHLCVCVSVCMKVSEFSRKCACDLASKVHIFARRNDTSGGRFVCMLYLDYADPRISKGGNFSRDRSRKIRARYVRNRDTYPNRCRSVRQCYNVYLSLDENLFHRNCTRFDLKSLREISFDVRSFKRYCASRGDLFSRLPV